MDCGRSSVTKDPPPSTCNQDVQQVRQAAFFLAPTNRMNYWCYVCIFWTPKKGYATIIFYVVFVGVIIHLNQCIVTPVHDVAYVQGFMVERWLVTNQYERPASQILQLIGQVVPVINCLQVTHNICTASVVHILQSSPEHPKTSSTERKRWIQKLTNQ